MNLDLNTLICDWQCAKDELSARIIKGLDGSDLVQLRVDLGVLQMCPDGRPDGTRYHGLPSALRFVEHELKLEHVVTRADWQELLRELQQLNYRRLALATLGEDSARHGDRTTAEHFLGRSVRDIEEALDIMRVIHDNPESQIGPNPNMVGTLLFSRARVLARLRVAQERVDDAIEVLQEGIDALDTLLADAGVDEEDRAEDSTIGNLRELQETLRRDYGVRQTLSEQLAEAVAAEDFEKAARIRDEMRRRGR